MSKQRSISSEQLLYILMNKREEENQKKGIIKKELKKDSCKILGLFPYKSKVTGEVKAGRLFLISELHDGYQYDIIYDETGDVIAYNDYSEKNGLTVAKEIELDKERLERQIDLIRGKDVEDDDNNGSNNNDTSKAGDGRDLASKEHEEKTQNKTEEPKKIETGEVDINQGQLRNLKDDISMDHRTRIRLDTVINGQELWRILGIQESLNGRMPKGVSERAFQKGYLTRIDSKELCELEASRGEKVKTRKAEDTFAIVSPSGDIVELDEGVIEPVDLGPREDRLLQEQNRERWADGEHTFKPATDMTLTRTSMWRIKDVNSRFTANEEWFLGVDYNEDYVKNGSKPSDSRYLKEVSIIQGSRNTDKVYSKDSTEARTNPTIEYKLEDAYEAPLNSKEQKQMKQLEKSDSNEAKNVRREHQSELEKVVEKLTQKYGENYRDEITQKVEEEHKKGNDVEEIEKNVKEEIDELEDEMFRHGRRRDM